MSAEDALGRQFIARRAAQLADQGLSLQRPSRQPVPAPGSVEESMSHHPAGKAPRPQRVIQGGGGMPSADEAAAKIMEHYKAVKDDPGLRAAGLAMRDQMTPEERRKMVRRLNKSKP